MRLLDVILLAAVPLCVCAQDNLPPTVRITEPISNVTLYSLSNSVTIRVEASDPDGTISQVRLLENGTVIASDLQPPYEFLYRPANFGAYTLEVRAVDNLGAGSSATRSIEYVRVNDNFGPLQTLQGTNLTLRSSTVEATRQKGEPNHAGAAGGKSVWWAWRPTFAGTVTIDTFGSDFDTVLGVYTNMFGLQPAAAISNLVTVAASDDDSANPPLSRVKFTATAMQTYYIAVDGRDGFAGNVVLNIRQTLSRAAVNDFIASATRIFASATLGGTNIGATKEPGEPQHAGNAGGASLWWRYEGDSVPVPVSISTAGSSFDTLLAVYTNAAIVNREGVPLMESLRLVTFNDDAGTSTSRTSVVEFIPRLGTAYWIAVDGYNGAQGNVRIALTRQLQGPRPTNDLFNAATVLRGSSVVTNVNTFSATSEFGEPSQIASKTGGKSVWYRWIAPATGTVYVSTKWSDFDTLLAVFIGTNITSLDHIASNDDDGGLPTSALTFTAVAGTEYRIAVAGYLNASGDLVLTLNQPMLVPPRITAKFTDGRIVFGASAADGTFVLEKSSDLVKWVVVGDVTADFALEELPRSDVPQQFYRLREAPR
jgi:hypothetical protein